MPILVMDAAMLAHQRAWGWLNISAPFWVRFILAVVLLDLAIYFQHMIFHAVPPHWRLHMVRPADLDIDLTTGMRFHPLEMEMHTF